MSARVYATCNIGEEALARLFRHGFHLEVHDRPEVPGRQRIIERVSSGLDALITTFRDPIDAEVLGAARGLKLVSQDAVGYDNIDVPAASALGIAVAHTPDVVTDATAEFALFMLGCLARRTFESERLVRENQWGPWHPSRPFLGDQVSGKTLGIVGAGRIGRSLALKCFGLEMTVLAHSRRPDHAFSKSWNRLNQVRVQEGMGRSGRFRWTSLQDCLRGSDFISVHLPLNEETRGMIDASAFKIMKKTAFLINTSRGPVVDQTALHRALKEGEIAGAALDVFEKEPLPQDSPLRDDDLLGRLRLFHHFGSGTRETRLSPDPAIGMAGLCVQNVIDVLEGADPAQLTTVVNRNELAARPPL